MQHTVVDLDRRVLDFERHDVEHMLTLCRVWDHPLGVLQPRAHIGV